MKRKLKVTKGFKTVLICLVIWGILFTTDIIRVKTKHSPMFCIPIAFYKDGGSIDYVGILYSVKKQVIDFELAIEGETDGFDYSMSPWFVNN